MPRPPARRYLCGQRQRCERRLPATRNSRRRPDSTAPEGLHGRSALDDALSLLGFRPHARRELELKLSRRGHPPEQVAAALDRVAELGYLDDAAFARTLAGDRAGRRGSRAIAAELRARGVGREAIEGVLSELDGDREREAAVLLARRRLKAGSTPDDRRRAAAALVRRGFDFETARLAVATAAGDTDDDVP